MSNLSTVPFTETINGTTIPSFPGAYVFRNAFGGGTNGMIPIYTSLSDFTANGLNDIMNDKDDTVLVLPGFSLTMYQDTNYGGTTTIINNSRGTDIMVSPTRIGASSCNLSFFNPPHTITQLYVYTSAASYTGPFGLPVTVVSQIGGSTFTWTGASNTLARVLVVGGGGGGGYSNGYEGGGGGGAGTVAVGTMNLVSGASYTITVGAGTTNTSERGGSSYIQYDGNNIVVAVGGGRGGQRQGTLGGSGGSGGGSGGTNGTGYQDTRGLAGTDGPYTDFQLYRNEGGVGGSGLGGAGGGGAGEQPTFVYSNSGWNGSRGGHGVMWEFDGNTYGGGGGGGGASDGSSVGYGAQGGTGGGGHGSRDGTVGTDGTGGGGGGGMNGYTPSGHTGGGGIVIIAV